jgi:hypothetical protein
LIETLISSDEKNKKKAKKKPKPKLEKRLRNLLNQLKKG